MEIEKKKMKLNGKEFIYFLKINKRQKNVILKFKEGKFVVSASKSVPKYIIEKFINKSNKWIEKRKKIEAKEKKSMKNITFDEKVFDNLKESALALVNERLNHFNKYYKFDYNKITIRCQKTRWGSCSSGKNLSFNVNILILTKEEQDYLIVHELCHLKEMNHSKNFWILVEKKIQKQKEIKKKLKMYRLNKITP